MSSTNHSYEAELCRVDETSAEIVNEVLAEIRAEHARGGTMTTVYVNASSRPPREISRDARDPQGPARQNIETYADTLSASGRLIRVYCAGQHVASWRKQTSPEYESLNGKATPDYRTIGA